MSEDVERKDLHRDDSVDFRIPGRHGTTRGRVVAYHPPVVLIEVNPPIYVGSESVVAVSRFVRDHEDVKKIRII